MFDVELRGVSKRYGNSDSLAVDDVSLQIEQGELLCLLGPSGCGKTTLLRMIAGFIDPTAGHVVIQGNDVTDVPPNKRNLGMVFQSYALFPHMTVYKNVEYGLRMRKVAKPEARERVKRILTMVGLLEMERRLPRQLSGGQQQRVALARAMVILPQVLLLDEPLSNLDAKLRQQMRIEIRRIQKEVGITSIFVTHDQEEAMTLADRIVIMDNGQIQQIGRPQDVYDRPETHFVANFIGACNFLPARLLSAETETELGKVETDFGNLLSARTSPGLKPDQKIIVAVRPEHISLSLTGMKSEGENLSVNSLTGRVEHISHLGSIVEYHVILTSGSKMRVQVQTAQGNESVVVGSEVSLNWNVDKGMCFKSN